ncbi:MAG: hypothetical protein SGI88_13450 [Candidatus Hydrogenedentes bacterium]|nr:hypothetical protein [Candidatus Hydrogenedentota bacterium]
MARFYRRKTVSLVMLLLVAPFAEAGFGFGGPAAIIANAVTDSRADGGSRLETNGNGVWIASWPRGPVDDETDVVISRSLDNGATWSAPLALNANPESDTVLDINPRLATDGSGNWVAIWVVKVNDDEVNADYDILVAHSQDEGATWSAPDVLSAKADIIAPLGISLLSGTPSPSLATDSAGSWLAVWRTTVPVNSNGDIDLLSSTSTDNGATWSTPVAVSAANDSFIDASPRAAATAPGEWMVVWNTIGFVIANGLHISRSGDNGATWSPPEALISYADSDPVRHNISRIETGGAGLWVGIGEYASHDVGATIPVLTSDYDIFLIRSEDNGETWSGPRPLLEKPGRDFKDDVIPVLTTDGAGSWLAAWTSQRPVKANADSDISASFSRDDGLSWTPVVGLNSNASIDHGNDSFPGIRTDGEGNWVAVWSSNNLLDENTADLDTDIHAARSTFTLGDKLIILTPNGGERIKPGKKTRIEWLSIGGIGDQVSLSVFRDGEAVSVIKESTANDGVYRWNVPESLAPGNGYKVKVQSVENPTQTDRSDRRFRIRASR